MESITKSNNGYLVKTTRNSYQTKTVLLAIGRRGTPRKLGVPGEEQEKVVYRLVDPEQYRGRHVLIVGGGDSALEAAHSIADEPDTHVTLSYRSEAFSRAKTKNRDKVQQYGASGKINLLMKSVVKQIEGDRVTIDHDGKTVTLKNDAVIVSAGGILPTGLLKEIGITVDTKHGTA
jgi:thioredoxin reductase